MGATFGLPQWMWDADKETVMSRLASYYGNPDDPKLFREGKADVTAVVVQARAARLARDFDNLGKPVGDVLERTVGIFLHAEGGA